MLVASEHGINKRIVIRKKHTSNPPPKPGRPRAGHSPTLLYPTRFRGLLRVVARARIGHAREEKWVPRRCCWYQPPQMPATPHLSSPGSSMNPLSDTITLEMTAVKHAIWKVEFIRVPHTDWPALVSRLAAAYS